MHIWVYAIYDILLESIRFCQKISIKPSDVTISLRPIQSFVVYVTALLAVCSAVMEQILLNNFFTLLPTFQEVIRICKSKV